MGMLSSLALIFHLGSGLSEKKKSGKLLFIMLYFVFFVVIFILIDNLVLVVVINIMFTLLDKASPTLE